MRRARLRRTALGLATLLGLRRRGFFIPYRHAGRVRRTAYPELEPAFRAAEPAMRGVLAAIDRHAGALLAIGEGPPPQPRWRQDWFPRLDAAAAYAIVREARPGRIVEVGSGHSTRFLARAIADGGGAARIAAIDPEPRAAIGGLAVELHRTTLEEALRAGAPGLLDFAAGDLLFVDSSHVLMPGSDVDLLLNRVVPRLPAGALLHVHDAFLPDDYPQDWAWRGYNEQQGVGALISGGGFEILFASHYAATRLAGAVEETVLRRLPLVAGARESSLWLRRR